MPKLNPETLLHAQMKMALNSYLASAIITATTSLLLYFVLQKDAITQPLYLQLWLAMQLSVCGVWVILYARYRHNFAPIKRIWASRLEMPLSLFSGLGWGLTWVLFINPDNLHTVILLNIITSTALFVYITSTPLHPAATNTGLVFCMSPIILECYNIGGELFSNLSIAGIILSLSVYLYGRELHKIYLSNLLQAEENQALLAPYK
jgi:hypothetical protein